MEDSFSEFYKKLDKESFKYFKREDGFYVYESDIDFLKEKKDIIVKKGLKECKVQTSSLEESIKYLLSEKKVKVEEYSGNKLTKIGYPGDWKDFADIMLDKSPPPSICAVKIEDKKSLKLSIAFMASNSFTIYTLIIDDDEVFSGLYNILFEINAFEIIFVDDKLERIFKSLDILTHKVKSSCSSFDILCCFLKIDIKSCQVKEYKRPNVCRIDFNTLNALNILDKKDTSVFGTFFCYTNQGYRLLTHFIKQPLINEEEINFRLNVVEEFRGLDFSVLKDFPDLLKIIRKIETMKISIQEMLKLYDTVKIIPDLLKLFNNKLLMNDFYTPLKDIYENLICMNQEIEKCVDFEAIKKHVFRLKRDISPSISDLYQRGQEIDIIISQEYKRINNISEKIKYDSLKKAFRVTRTDYQGLTEVFRKNYFLVINFLKSSVFFTTKTLSECNKEKEELESKILKEEGVVLNNLRGFLKERISYIEIFNYIIALCDVFHSFSIKSKTPGYCRPIFKDKMRIEGFFHPLLESKDYIENNLKLYEKRMVIITGPNMGGKSTFLKSIGTIAILAQMGCYVPSKKCEIPIFDGIYIRIGANDCAVKHESTFMVEMKDIARICRLSTLKSLVLIDELGRGTCEIDGLSLAMAVKDYLKNLKCITLFATHFPELCTDDVLNKKAANDGLTLLYKIVDGICDTSFGINVAERVGFPKAVIDDAKRYLNDF